MLLLLAIGADDLLEDRQLQAARTTPPTASPLDPDRKLLLTLLAEILPEVPARTDLAPNHLHLYAVKQSGLVPELVHRAAPDDTHVRLGDLVLAQDVVMDDAASLKFLNPEVLTESFPETGQEPIQVRLAPQGDRAVALAIRCPLAAHSVVGERQDRTERGSEVRREEFQALRAGRAESADRSPARTPPRSRGNAEDFAPEVPRSLVLPMIHALAEDPDAVFFHSHHTQPQTAPHKTTRSDQPRHHPSLPPRAPGPRSPFTACGDHAGGEPTRRSDDLVCHDQTSQRDLSPREGLAVKAEITADEERTGLVHGRPRLATVFEF